MIVLGIDPGTASTGWGVVELDGNRFARAATAASSRRPRTRATSACAASTTRRVCLLRRFSPDVVAIEELFVNVNVKTALAVGQARGVLILAASDLETAPFEYSPLQIKMSVTGYGRASKLQVQEMTKVLLGLDRIPQPDHAADALAVAICHAHNHNNSLPPAARGGGRR